MKYRLYYEQFGDGNNVKIFDCIQSLSKNDMFSYDRIMWSVEEITKELKTSNKKKPKMELTAFCKNLSNPKFLKTKKLNMKKVLHQCSSEL
jgi:hypothetical protein